MVLLYHKIRQQIYDPIRDEGIFTWDEINGQEYALANFLPVSREFVKEIRYATQVLGDLFTKVTKILQTASSSLYRELGIPQEAFDFCRISLDHPSVTTIGRFDFAYTTKGLKLLEFNSDTPTSVVEAFYVNGRVCDWYGCENPNEGLEIDIQNAFLQVTEAYRKAGYSTNNLAFTSLDWHEEDAGTTRYLMKHSGVNGKFVPISSLAIQLEEDRLYSYVKEEDQYIPIDWLYRLHAIEMFVGDHDADGYPIGAHILKLVKNRKLAMVNPPTAFLAQTKALQGLIWALHEQKCFFTDVEHDLIETYFLPTYLDNVFAGNRAYVSKPVLGREGGAVSLYSAANQLLARDGADQYWNQLMVYQEMADLPMVETETLQGAFCGKLLWGSFYVGGKASALVTRLDREITGNLAYFYPFGM